MTTPTQKALEALEKALIDFDFILGGAIEPTAFAISASDKIREALAALKSSPEQEGWRPIESAPRDGTVIDFWHDSRRLAGWWWSLDLEKWVSDDGHIFPGSGKLPTHWMPLPHPPIQGEKCGGKE